MKSNSQKYLIVFVGLPAHGKSFLALKLYSFFNSLEIPTRIFNLGDVRRKVVTTNIDSNFFKHENQEAQNSRELCAKFCLEEATEFLQGSEKAVALYDGTNSTEERRNWLRRELSKTDFKVVWVEKIIEKEEIRVQNVKKSKIHGQDYKSFANKDLAFQDFMERIEEYKKTYVPISQREISEMVDQGFFVIYNLGETVRVVKEGITKDYIWFLLENYLLKIYTKKKKVTFKNSVEKLETRLVDLEDGTVRIETSGNLLDGLNRIFESQQTNFQLIGEMDDVLLVSLKKAFDYSLI